MKLERLSSEEFDRILANTRHVDQSRAILRAVLVDGRNQTATAQAFGVTRQWVNKLLEAFKREFLEQPNAGDAVVVVALGLPESLTLELANFSEEWNDAAPEAKSQALEKALRAIRAGRKILKGASE